ncbi:CobW/HypB/UreG, nucleotide-binding domain-containing protein [Lentinula lateritia]|uniref:CobW/HypB/UreG, nucleotide-binding domain-containing protein n=1 Tax=Lentinula aff. lateritia TaxID=2804960 RepID=A0ACC1TXY4_9AGAR|nr:CobW/HypB/UreG, nucleotide-binding domain-containing protein [Lentinula aff. lateritia]KAJ3854416.1 CobW/HypB/UreG, nucleotide-binding domain-containing protein [Lentinula lateritia]
MTKTTIPITVFTGFLGAGKTTVILSLLPKLPKDNKVVLLKNEYGDVEVDSKLAKESSLTAVSEILNGCMCCVLVGQMQNALLEIRDQYHPDRIIIECSGSAFPATLAFQIREMERNTGGDFKLDSIITVIDAENFAGYEDTSPTAKMQASYTDVILINKWESVSDRQLDIVMDHLHTLNDLTPKIRCDGRDGVDPSLIFGIDSKLFQNTEFHSQDPSHVDEVQTLTLYRGSTANLPHKHGDDHEHSGAENHLINPQKPIRIDTLEKCLTKLGKESVWRVKGFVRVQGVNVETYIVNWAFGRYELTKSEPAVLANDCSVQLTAMGEQGELRRAVGSFCRALELSIL